MAAPFGVSAGDQNGNVWYYPVTTGVTPIFPHTPQLLTNPSSFKYVTIFGLSQRREPIAGRWVLGDSPHASRRAGPALRSMEGLHAGPASRQVGVRSRIASSPPWEAIFPLSYLRSGSFRISLASSSGICDAHFIAGESQRWGFVTSDALGRPRTLAAGWPSRMSKARLKAAAPWRELRLRTPGFPPACPLDLRRQLWQWKVIATTAKQLPSGL